MLVASALEAFARKNALRYDRDVAPDGLQQINVYSHDMKYRYALVRWWQDKDPLVLWIGVNPAKGDTEMRRRPTLERCIKWSREWKAGGLIFANLFAARHNEPKALSTTTDPVGPFNDAVLKILSPMAERTMVAWGGKSKAVRSRAAEIAPLLTDPRCLGLTRDGQPRHPLYVRGDAVVQHWSAR